MTVDEVRYRRWPRPMALLMISRVPFWFIWISPLVLGYTASAGAAGANELGWFVVVAAFGCVIESGNCVHNELVDRREDAINQPRRLDLLASVGTRNAIRFVITCYVTTALLSICVGVFVNPLIGGMMLVSAVIAPMYNWGPHFKRHTGVAELAIAVAVMLSFAIGWSWNAPIADVPAAVWVLGYFFGIMSFVKDLPDAEGDASVGAPGLLTISRGTLRTVLLGGIYVSPYVLVLVLVGTGALEPRFLWTLVLLPVGAWMALAAERAGDTMNGLIVGYQLAFTYVHLFLLAVLVLVAPGAPTLAVAVGLFAARSLALLLGVDARQVEPDFRWSDAVRLLATRPARAAD